jgi:hypothetical protein
MHFLDERAMDFYTDTFLPVIESVIESARQADQSIPGVDILVPLVPFVGAPVAYGALVIPGVSTRRPPAADAVAPPVGVPDAVVPLAGDAPPAVVPSRCPVPSVPRCTGVPVGRPVGTPPRQGAPPHRQGAPPHSRAPRVRFIP